MTKTTKDSKEKIEKNLKYIGLDLEKIPKFLTKFEPLNFRPLKSYDEKIYKVYRHVNVKEIEILITKADRITELKERYKLASPIYTYLDGKNEENIEKFASFLTMISNLKAEKIEELENEQKKLKENLPTKIKYDNNFIWQVYYSDDTQRYFMLVPEKEQDQSAMFYLLKQQIAGQKSRKKDTIFIPISHLEYSGNFLSKSEIIDIENYLWYFTKDWVSVYEVYDIKNNMSIKIVGNTNVYEKMKSDYTITLNNKQESIEFYKMLKAMFILATGSAEEYNFVSKISSNGNLQFFYKGSLISYEGLPQFITNEYIEKIEALEKLIKENEKLETRLKRFNLLVAELTEDYLSRQRQIATFLECKKTFFGRVKYFFKKKKDVKSIKKPEKLETREIRKEENLQALYQKKEQYTIEDLINICSKLEEKKKENTNLSLDIAAIESKKDILTKKIDNADLYIKEIDSHKKSIFEFWKFTSKDELQTLNEGERIEETKKNQIEKYFDYEVDFEDLGKIVDELQRRKLSKSETDSIFAARHVIASVRELNSIEKNKNPEEVQENSDKEENKYKVLERELKRLKEEYKGDLEYINIKDFNIFGGLSEDKTQIKTINNEKHREIEKDKYKVLNINTETKLEAYKETLKNYLGLINEALHKIKSPYNMAIYKVNNKKTIDGINIFDIDPEKALAQALKSNKEELILCRLNIKENMSIIYYSNIMFYDNFNKTLPVGMNLSSEVLVNVDKFKLSCVKCEEFNINYDVNEFETETKKIKVYEYDTETIGK